MKRSIFSKYVFCLFVLTGFVVKIPDCYAYMHDDDVRKKQRVPSPLFVSFYFDANYFPKNAVIKGDSTLLLSVSVTFDGRKKKKKKGCWNRSF